MSAPAGTAPTRSDLSLRGRWRALRNRLIANPAFQRWAARFPLTRPVARRRAAELFDLCAGFVYAQTLLACVRLDLCTVLAEGPDTAGAIGQRVGLSPDAARLLLGAAAALRLAEATSDGRFGLGDLGAALIGNPGVAAMVRHHPMLYADLADPVALLRGPGGGGDLARFWAYARAGDAAALPDDAVGPYSMLMAASNALVAGDILDVAPLAGRRRLLDVGGGEGGFALAAADRHPGLAVTVFDLPAVAARAAARIAAAGLSGRIATAGGDFLREPLPAGADAISLVRIVHDHDDGAVMTLLRAAHAALPPGGLLLVAEPMSGAPGAAAMTDAYFAFYMRAMGSGRPRSAATIAAMLREVGFADVRAVPTLRPMLTSVVAARR